MCWPRVGYDVGSHHKWIGNVGNPKKMGILERSGKSDAIWCNAEGEREGYLWRKMWLVMAMGPDDVTVWGKVECGPEQSVRTWSAAAAGMLFCPAASYRNNLPQLHRCPGLSPGCACQTRVPRQLRVRCDAVELMEMLWLESEG